MTLEKPCQYGILKAIFLESLYQPDKNNLSLTSSSQIKKKPDQWMSRPIIVMD